MLKRWMLGLLILAACGQSTQTTESNPNGSVSVVTTTSSLPLATTLPEPTTTVTMPSTTTTVTEGRAPLGYTLPSDFLLVDDDGLWLVEGDGSFVHLATGDVFAAFDDRMGGVILQGYPWTFGEAVPPIYRISSDSNEAMALVTPGEQEIVSLEGVTEIDGRPTLLYLSRTWFSNPSTASEVLVALDLEDGTSYPITTTGGWESGANRATFGGGVFAVEGSGEGFTWLDFIDVNGFSIEYPTNPISDIAECFDTFECPSGSVIAPDGLTLLFARQLSGSDPQLVELFLSSGAESVYEITAFPFWLDFDGELVAAYLAPPWNEVFADTLVLELSDSGITNHAALPGRASIVYSSVDLSGPVELPILGG